MDTSEKKRVTDFLNDVQLTSPEQVEIISSLRFLFNEANQNLSEEIKYGGLVFVKSGSLIGGIYPYKEHITVEFSNGAGLPDPLGLLNGKGKKRRHLKIMDAEDISNAKSFIAQAAKG